MCNLAAFLITIETFIHDMLNKDVPSRYLGWQFVLYNDLSLTLNDSRLNCMHSVIKIFVHKFGIELMNDFANVKFILFFGTFFEVLIGLVTENFDLRGMRRGSLDGIELKREWEYGLEGFLLGTEVNLRVVVGRSWEWKVRVGINLLVYIIEGNKFVKKSK
jgi:hypothetical protein